MTRLLVVVPYYGDDPVRERNLQAVVRHLWDGGFDECTLKVTPQLGRSMAHARNAGLEHVRGPGHADVVVFNDADSLVDPGRIREAAELAADGQGVVFAYDLYVRLSQDGTALYHAGNHECERLPIEGEPFYAPTSVGCVAVAARGCPLFHTGFTGWGYEDLEWLDRCADQLGPHRRLNGAPLYHLWHGGRNADDSPAGSDAAMTARNRRLWLELREAKQAAA